MAQPLAVINTDQGINNAWSSFATFVPRVVGFLVILIVGYIVAKVVAKIVDKVLERVGFDRAVERGGVKQALSKSKYDASDIVAKLAFWFIFIATLSIAFGQLGIAALEQPMAQLLALLPKILVAVVLVVVGGAIAAGVKSLLRNALGGLSYGRAVANAVAVLILIGFVKSALDQVGLATTVTTPLLYTFLAMVAGVT